MIGHASKPAVDERPFLMVTFLLAAIAASIALTVAGWYFGDSTSSEAEIARFLPVMDAVGYHNCASSLAAFGSFDEAWDVDWCTRRVLYPALLATEMRVLNFDSANVLLLQSALAGIAIVVFGMRIARYVGKLGVAVAVTILCSYAWEFLVGLFVTEVAGFTLGLLGFSLLLSFIESRRPVELLLACVFLSVASVARAGALFTLPAIALWAFFLTKDSGLRRWARFAISIAGLAVGMALQAGTLLIMHLDPSNTGGNFATSLYGLSIGSREWTDAGRHFGSLFSAVGEKAAYKHIYEVAIQNIISQPGNFVSALYGAQVDYLRSLFRFGFLEIANPLLSALAFLGCVSCVRAIQSPIARLMLFLAAGELVSAPLIYDSGGTRIFAATIFIRVALCALGARFLLLTLLKSHSAMEWTCPARFGVSGVAAVIVGSVMIGAMVLQPSGVSRNPHLPSYPQLGCDNGLVEVILRPNESHLMLFTASDTSLESVRPFRIGRDRFVGLDRLERTAFFNQLHHLERPTTILRAIDLSPEPVGKRVKSLVFRGEIETSASALSLCVDPAQKVQFVDWSHLVVLDVRRLPSY